MPTNYYSSLSERRGPKKWRDMERWERKAFHRVNALRAMNGKPLLPKP